MFVVILVVPLPFVFTVLRNPNFSGLTPMFSGKMTHIKSNKDSDLS